MAGETVGTKNVIVNVSVVSGKNDINKIVSQIKSVEAEFQKINAQAAGVAGSTKALDIITTKYQKVLNATTKQWKSMRVETDEYGNSLRIITEDSQSWYTKMNMMRWQMVNALFIMRGFAAAVKPFADLVKYGMEWELQLKRIEAVTGQIGSNVRDFIKEARQGTPFTSFEAGTTFLEFTKAGFSAKEAMTAMRPIMDLATAGFTDLATSGKIVAQTMHEFAVEGVSARQAADIIYKASIISAMGVEDFGVSMSYVGPYAAALGFSLKEVSAAMVILSNAGFQGSKAGTVLRQILSQMTDPTKEAEQTMLQLGISFYDSSGKIKSLDESLRTLYVTLSKLAPQEQAKVLGTMFNIRGRAGAAAFMNALRDSVNIAGVEKEMDRTADAATAAHKQMEASANRVKDALENLRTSFEPLGAAFNNVFSGMVSGADEAFKSFSGFASKNRVVGATVLAGGAAGVTAGGVALWAKINSFISRGVSPANPQYVKDVSNIKPGDSNIGKAVGTAGLGGFLSRSMGFIGKVTFWSGVIIAAAEGVQLAVRTFSDNKDFNIYKEAWDFGMSGFQAMGELANNTFLDIKSRVTEILKSLFPAASDAIDGLSKIWDTYKSLNEPILSPEKATVAPDNVEIDRKTMKLSVDNAMKEIEKLIAENDTPIAAGLTKKFFEGDKSIFSTISAAASQVLNRINETFKPSIGFMRDLKYDISGVISQISALETNVTSLEAQEKLLNDEISRQRDVMEAARDKLSDYKDQLSEVQSSISNLSSMRFEMETPFSKLIREQEQVIARHRLMELGITDAEAFIRDSLTMTGDSYGGIVDSIEKVTEASSKSQDIFKAWRETVHEHIRALIEESQDLGTDTTSAVQRHMTLYLSASAIASGSQGMTESEYQLQRLQAAQEYYFGYMHDQVQFAIQEDQDRTNGVANNATTVISSLASEWVERDRLERKIASQEAAYSRLEKQLKDMENDRQSIIDDIEDEKEKIDELTASIYKLIRARARELQVAAGGGSSFYLDYISRGGGSSATDIINDRLAEEALNNQLPPTVPEMILNGLSGNNSVPINNISLGGITVNAGQTTDPAKLANALAWATKNELDSILVR